MALSFTNQNAGGSGGPLRHATIAARHEMVEKQIRKRGVLDPQVLRAMEEVPRHEFVPQELRARAYEDVPLPIGGNQTISQPYIVAAMTAALHLQPSDRVLDVGTGCGYQAAIFSRIVANVYSIEVRGDLAESATQRLSHLGFANVHVVHGDGSLGLPGFAPFNAILVAAAAPSVPQPLVAQLAEGGRLILPVGPPDKQQLVRITRHGSRLDSETLEPCQFVPLIGRHGWQEPLS